MGEKLGYARRSDFGGIVSHFLLLRDQATYREDLKRFENKTLTSPFMILILGKSPNLRIRGFY